MRELRHVPPAKTDPYAYFAARGVSREALRDFFDAEVQRSVSSNRVEGGPIAELYRLLGLDWMVTLVALLGGTESYVPSSEAVAIRKWPELPAELCGVLVDVYGGGRVEAPSLRGLFAACRRKLMAERMASGLSSNAVAREFGVTARYVRQVISDAPGPNQQTARKPRPRDIVVERRRDEIMRRHALGERHTTIANVVGVSLRQVNAAIRRTSVRATAKADAPC